MEKKDSRLGQNMPAYKIVLKSVHTFGLQGAVRKAEIIEETLGKLGFKINLFIWSEYIPTIKICLNVVS